eukprot:CAMPEP_0113935904 /NCGR_PEP_ID=MMETSP1339-20121228/2937_1 /TAXON_ID=94617 /ORGANISM="Fibrocapsa japonica" /LENGTH=133 /DNA_ID=CAMNT_0000938195 /DNA_START=42 /DNA_END=443 /DNA_ORIENTATION=- /assembly_acc=CAM_ASM_000762
MEDYNEAKDEFLAELERKVENRPDLKLSIKNLRRHQKSMAQDDEDIKGLDNRDDDTRSVARSIMSEGGRSVRSVHSTKSISALAQRSRDRQMNDMGEASTLTVQPRIITHNDEDRMNKHIVSNLPYMHRNPAI